MCVEQLKHALNMLKNYIKRAVSNATTNKRDVQANFKEST